MNISDYKLKAPIDYKITMMWVALASEFEIAGVTVHVVGNPLKTGNIEAVRPQDDWQLTRLLDKPDFIIMGRGILIEKVSASVWFVAWRPYNPAPHIDDSNWTK